VIEQCKNALKMKITHNNARAHTHTERFIIRASIKELPNKIKIGPHDN
jgi:hypothetical protein